MNIEIECGNVVRYSHNVGRSITIYEPKNPNAHTVGDGDLMSTTFKVSSPELFEKYKNILNKIDEEMMQIQTIEEINAKELRIVYKKKNESSVVYLCSNTPTNLRNYTHIKEKQELIRKNTADAKKHKKDKRRLIALLLASVIILGSIIANKIKKTDSEAEAKTTPSATTQTIVQPTNEGFLLSTNSPELTLSPIATQAPTSVPTQAPTAQPTQLPTAMPIIQPTQAPTALPTIKPEPAVVVTVEPVSTKQEEIPVKTNVKSNYNAFRDSYYKIVSKEESRNVSEEDLNIAYELISSRYGIIKNSLNPDKEITVVHIVDSYIMGSLYEESGKYLISNFLEDEAGKQELRALEDELRKVNKGKGDSKVFGATVNKLTKQGFYKDDDFGICLVGLRNLDIDSFDSDAEFERYLGLVLNNNFFTMNNYLQISTLGASLGDAKIFNDNQDTMGSFIVLRNKSRQLVSEIILMTPEEKSKAK